MKSIPVGEGCAILRRVPSLGDAILGEFRNYGGICSGGWGAILRRGVVLRGVAILRACHLRGAALEGCRPRRGGVHRK